MKSLLYSFFSFLVLIAGFPALAQQGWPKVITTGSGTEVRVFEFQPQSLYGNNLKLQAAISVKETPSAEPVFGMIWGDATIVNDQANLSRVSNLVITNLKVPGISANNDVGELKSILENEVPKLTLNIPMNELNAKIDANQNQSKLSANINNTPPKIIYSKSPSILVYIDGQPQLQKNTAWGLEQVINTPFTIIKNNDQQFYLYGNKKWFQANAVTGNWVYQKSVPYGLAAVHEEVSKADTSAIADNSIPNVIVTTVPAELIQSKGEPNFAPIQGTNLLYMTNTNNDIFLDINSQAYYVLISGRWYKAANLNSNWTYTASNNLPADFAKIPEGSSKDMVLANIAGTAAAEESLLDAQVPQTARVNRKSATANVDYDGEPQFEQIEGTAMKYAVNTPGAVINDGRRYYYVENGVWFESYNANGPWEVATERPDGVENIPPSSPLYNIKYVYIYDATPEYVYMGYTPGYLGTYIYGPTIVYGTGYHYRPWRGRNYYARPVTWGFNMRYNPWNGWNVGIGYGRGWFFSEYGNYNNFGHRDSHRYSSYGWWGPSEYRPQYERDHGNYYGHNVVINNNYIISNNRSNNVYRSRRDVVSYDRPGYDMARNNRYQGNGSANNNGRHDAGNYSNANNSGGHDVNNNNSTQRPGRFGMQQRPGNNRNVGVSPNNNINNNQGNRLPVDRTNRVYRPQGNNNANADNASGNNGNDGNSAGGSLNNVGHRRITSPGQPTNTTNNYPHPANPQDNTNSNSGRERVTEQLRTRSQHQSTENTDYSRDPLRGRSSDINQGNEQPSRPQRVVTPGRTETPRVNSYPEQRQRVAAPERTETPRRSSEHPQRVYAPQRNVESPHNNQSAEPGVEIRRVNPSQETNRGNGGFINHGAQGTSSQGSFESRKRRLGNQ